MAKVQVLDVTGKQVNEMILPGEIFSYPEKQHLLYETVINYRANQRRGTASTKTRSEVRGGGRKPWRQKGTGRARAGSNRSPLWRSGGTSFGPKYKDYGYRMPKKAKRNALKSVLSLRLAEKKLLVLESINIEEAKTKKASELLKTLKLDSVLFVDSSRNRNFFLSMRNIPKAKVVDFSQVNVYDVLDHDWLVFTRGALESLMERLK
ncbi:MAG: 50S ribosomal protein L4 [Candidatus Aminicenantes bacterium]|nr:50S ribosomal protein L4 [Candidatus Aminicenantes bacterium]